MKVANVKYKISELRSEKEISDWDQFIYENMGGFFQSVLYYRFCCQLDEYEPSIIVAYEHNKIVGSILAIIHTTGQGIRKYFSRRAIVIGGPVVKIGNDDSHLYDVLLDRLDFHIGKRVIYTEFRNLFSLSDHIDSFNKHGYLYKEHLNVQLSLSNEEEVMKRISSSKKRQIRKSQKNGVEVIEPNDVEEVRDFYHILVALYKSKVKKPLPSWNFFLKLYNLSLKSDHIKIFLVKHKREILGGIISPIYNGTIYEWYIANKELESNDIYPAVIATWSAIEYGIKNNLTQFDFLGAGKPNEDYGVRDFKLKFGGELMHFGRFLKLNQKLLYNIGSITLRVLKIL